MRARARERKIEREGGEIEGERKCNRQTNIQIGGERDFARVCVCMCVCMCVCVCVCVCGVVVVVVGGGSSPS